MANVLVEESSLQAIADAIRYKAEGTDTYKPREMASAIRNLPGTGVLQNLSVTENGNYTPPSGVDGFNSVSVAVPGGFGAGDEGKVIVNGALMPQTSLSVTANGTYDTTAKNSVVVSVSGGGTTGIDWQAAATVPHMTIYTAASVFDGSVLLWSSSAAVSNQ